MSKDDQLDPITEDAPVFRTFIVTMGKKCDYVLDYGGINKCRKSKDNRGMLNRCKGKLNDRPCWCPMREITSEGSLKE